MHQPIYRRRLQLRRPLVWGSWRRIGIADARSILLGRVMTVPPAVFLSLFLEARTFDRIINELADMRAC